MEISVVIPTHNQESRLALVLAGLAAQDIDRDRFEVLVVDDGCTDASAEVVAGYARGGDICVRLLGGTRLGRNRARNLGLEEAGGALTVFLDADALPAPDLLRRYAEAHEVRTGEGRSWSTSGERPPTLRTVRTHGAALYSGLQHHLPDLEYLADPRLGTLIEGDHVPSVVRDVLLRCRADLRLTEHQVRTDFERVRRRARVGSYPNTGTVLRQTEARQLLRERPRSSAGWLAFIPHNGAGPTSLLRSVGGFDVHIPFNEGWELAYRLQRQRGACVVPVEASTYHLYHFHDFDDTAQSRTRYDAVEYMAHKHRDPRIRLLYFWYAHLWPDPLIPGAAVVQDLFEFERLYHELPESTWRQYETVLRNHPKQLPLKEIEVNYGTCA